MTTVTCEVCGSDVDVTGSTCPVCGADLHAASDLPPSDDPATGSDTRVGPSSASSAGATTPPPPPPAAGPVGPPPATAAGAPPSPYAPVAYRPSTADPTHPSGLASWVRTWGVLTHLSAFVAAFFLVAFVGPLVMWLIRRDEHPFLDHHGKEAVNFNLSMLLYTVIAVVLSVVTIGLGLVVVIPLGIVLFFTWLIAPIVAAVKAGNGEGFRYPVTIRFIAD